MQNCPVALLDMTLVQSHKATSTIASYTSLNQVWTAEFCNVMKCIAKMIGLHTFINIYCNWLLQVCAVNIYDRDASHWEKDILLYLLLWLH